MSADSSIEKKLEVGAVLMIAMRWTIRFMGLFNTVILARLLSPEDFGIVAMAMIFQVLIEGMINLNVQLVLIRNQSAGPAHYHTAWTIGILQFALIALVLVAGAGFASDYYQEPRLQVVVYVMALAIFLRGLVNIGVVDFRKELNFALDVKYEIFSQAVRIVATIGLAIWLRSYWAMVLGILSGSVAAVVLSYIMSPFRPRLSLEKFGEIFGVSTGIWLENLNRFVSMQADRLILGRLVPTATLGGYSVAVDLARLPSGELVLPLSRALVPGYARVKDDLPRMAGFFRILLGAASLCAAPIAFGFPLIAVDFVAVVLGDQWGFIVPMLQIGAVLAVIELLAGTNRPLLLAAGGLRPLNIALSVETLSLISVVYPAFQWQGVEGVLLGLIGVRSLALLLLFGLSARTLGVTYGSLFAPMLRPLLAGAVMLAGLWWLPPLSTLAPLRMAITLAIGGLIYGVTVMALWWLQGQPEGLEKTLVGRLRQRLGKSA